LKPDLSTTLFKPREAIRSPRAGFGGGLNPSLLRYPQAGAEIDYYLPSEPSGDITMEIMDSSGKVVRTISSAAGGRREGGAAGGGGGDEEGGGFAMRTAPARLEKTSGMHRFTWDLRYPGPWMSAARPEGPNGPAAVPGKYTVKLTVGSWTATQPLTLIEDPRITKSGLTEAALRDQFEHNLRVRELVSDVNKLVARVRAAQRNASGAQRDKLNEFASHLITPAIRYSQPELQTQITYLYSETTATDQRVGGDAKERYEVLRKELDGRIAEANQILGGR
jgi:hypothetical protein